MKRLGRSSRRQLLRIGAAMGGGILAGQQKVFGWDTPGKLGTPLGSSDSSLDVSGRKIRWYVEAVLGCQPRPKRLAF